MPFRAGRRCEVIVQRHQWPPPASVRLMDRISSLVDSLIYDGSTVSYDRIFHETDGILSCKSAKNYSGITLWVTKPVSNLLHRGLIFEPIQRRVSFIALKEKENVGLAMGKVELEGGALDALVVKKLSSSITALAAWRLYHKTLSASNNPMIPTMWPTTSGDLQLSLYRRGPSSVSNHCFSSMNAIFGYQHMRWLYAAENNHIAFGGEVYYIGTESSGGVSLGAKWIHSPNHRPIITAFTVNPIMGQLQMALSAGQLASRLSFSTKYDFNAYSLDSDLAAGIAYNSNNGKELDNSISCSISSRRGIILSLTALLFGGENRLRVGITSGSLPNRPLYTEGLPVGSQTSSSISIDLIFDN